MKGRWRPSEDVDLADRTLQVEILWFCEILGLAAGAAVGFMLFRWHPVQGALVFGLPCGLIALAVARGVIEGSGRAVGGLLNPSAAGSPRRYELSREEALIAAGRTEDAAVALEDACAQYPEDPRPPVMLAELCRDQLHDPERAVEWYRRAAAGSPAPSRAARSR